MTSPWVRFLMIAPVFVFATGTILLGLGGISPLVFLVTALVVLPVLSVLDPRAIGWLLAPSVVVFAFVGLLSWFSQGAIPTGAAGDVIFGALLGLPLWFLGVCVSADNKPGVGLLALQAGLLEMVTLESALAAVPSGANTDTFLNAWFTTIGHQLGALASALSGNGLRVAQVVPLATYADPLFIVLALLALAGLLLPMIGDFQDRPSGRPTPSRRDLAESVRLLPPPVLYATASEATPPRPPAGAGLAPVVGTAIAVLAFLEIASSDPTYTFLIVTAVVVGAVVILVRLAAAPGRPVPAPKTPRRALRPSAR
ncbi:MAG TPA: hypothetical protein VN864_03705 [Thermoplasmata archaeon]|nr:hypothetical protein [Thermoplasmata archaeon]